MKEQSGYLSRQKNFKLTFFIILALFTRATAQINPMTVGARSWGIANATVAGVDSYSVYNNVAGLAGNREASLLSSYDSHYGFEGLSTMGFAAVLPISEDFSSGFSIQRFGDKLYNELSMGIGVGHRIERFSLGIKINYLQTAINAPSLAFSGKAFVVEFGGIARIRSDLSFGAHLYNLTQSSFSGVYGNRVPTSVRVGLLYLPLKTVRLSTEIEKNTELPLSLKVGLAYQVWKKISLRTGLASKPLTHHFGTGFTHGRFSVDYGAHSNAQLGWSHHFSLAYSIRELKQKE